MTLLFAKYAREVAKALPSDQAYPLRDSEKRTARASNGLALGLISGFWHHERSFHNHALRDSLSPPFVIYMKRQALLARFRSAQIRGFKSGTRNHLKLLFEAAA